MSYLENIVAEEEPYVDLADRQFVAELNRRLLNSSLSDVDIRDWARTMGGLRALDYTEAQNRKQTLLNILAADADQSSSTASKIACAFFTYSS